MPVEQAIVDFVVEGADVVEATTDKIGVNLAALEKSAKDTDESVKTAVESAKELSSALRRLSRAAHAAVNLAKAAGLEEDSTAGRLAELGVNTLSRASEGARVGSMFGPYGTLAGAGVGSLVGMYEAIKKVEKKIDDANDKVLDKIAKKEAHDLPAQLKAAAETRQIDALLNPARGAQ